MVPYNITEKQITVIANGQVFQVDRDSFQAPSILAAIKRDASEYEIAQLCTPKVCVTQYSGGRLTIAGTDVKLDGEPVADCIRTKIIDLMKGGFEFEYLVRFLDKLDGNTSNRAITELYTFLEHEGLCITPQGNFLAYKGVGTDMYSVRGNPKTRVLQGHVNGNGQILNSVGSTIEVDRRDVDDNCNRTCSHGLHVGSFAYASSWGPEVVIVEVDPADVVSIPSDCDGQKARVCKYRVTSVCRGLIKNAVANPDNPYASMRPAAPDDTELEFDQDDIDGARESGYEDGYSDGYSEGANEVRDDVRSVID